MKFLFLIKKKSIQVHDVNTQICTDRHGFTFGVKSKSRNYVKSKSRNYVKSKSRK